MPYLKYTLIALLSANIAFAQRIDVTIAADLNVGGTGLKYKINAPIPAFWEGPREGIVTPGAQSSATGFDTLSLLMPAEVIVEIRDESSEVYSATVVSNLSSPTVVRTIYQNPKYDVVLMALIASNSPMGTAISTFGA